MNGPVASQLRAAGWWPERQVEIEAEIRSIERTGVEVWPELMEFLAEYARLKIDSHDGMRTLSLDVTGAAAGTDPEWGGSYSKMIGVVLAPVGEYSHMTIYLARDGIFYGGFDAEYGRIADSLEGLVDSVLNKRPAVRLDQELS